MFPAIHETRRCITVLFLANGFQVLSAVCVGLVSYFGDRYYYDVEAQAAEWMLMVLKNVLKVEQMDVWKPVTFFLAVTAACLLNSFCLLVACVTSHATASKIAQTIYVRTHSRKHRTLHL